MSDFNATFAVNDACTLLNVGGVSALCDCCQTRHHSLKHLSKDRRRRAKRSFLAGANCCSGHKNVLTRCR